MFGGAQAIQTPSYKKDFDDVAQNAPWVHYLHAFVTFSQGPKSNMYNNNNQYEDGK